jgi:hypothetical protein
MSAHSTAPDDHTVSRFRVAGTVAEPPRLPAKSKLRGSAFISLTVSDGIGTHPHQVRFLSVPGDKGNGTMLPPSTSYHPALSRTFSAPFFSLAGCLPWKCLILDRLPYSRTTPLSAAPPREGRFGACDQGGRATGVFHRGSTRLWGTAMHSYGIWTEGWAKNVPKRVACCSDVVPHPSHDAGAT